MTIPTALTGLLSVLLWALIALCQLVAWLAYRALTGVFWCFWPIVLIGGTLGFLIAAAQSAEAGWFSWLWGSGADIKKIERSAELAQEAARVTSEAARAHAEQAVAHAEQNARVAELLGALSQERQSLAEHVTSLSTLGLQDSQIAAVLGASGPVLVCLTVLLVAGLALWLTSRASTNPQADFVAAVDMMAEELAVVASTEHPASPRLEALAGARSTGPGFRLLGFSGGNLRTGNSPGPDSPAPENQPSDELYGPESGDPDEGPMPF
jgi:hypothetical protein